MGDALNQPTQPHVRSNLLLSRVAFAASLLVAGSAQALGLGRLQVQSALGETLRAEIEVVSLSAEEEGSLRVRVAPPDAFRAQGLDYNAVLAGTQVQLVRQSNGRVVLRLVSDRAVQEPFLDVLLDIRWATGRLNREYTLLFDPPGSPAATSPAAAQAPAAVAPIVSAAAVPQRPTAAAAPVPAPTPVAAPTPAPTAAPAPRPVDGAIAVRPGDSLSRLAGAHKPAGVSLDQMLVALYRENPGAFIGGNMNLLRAGARLRMPAADQLSALGADEARRLVRAHSSNFDSVRQGLAAAAPSLPPQSEREVKGVVQPKVAEARPPAPGGDRLTLSKPGGAASAPAPAASRLADAARDLEATRKLAEAAKQEVAQAAPAPTVATPASAVASAAVALAPPASAAASIAVAAASQAASRAAVAPPPPPPAEPQEGWLDMLLSPLGAGAAAVLLALGAAVIYRVGKQRKTGPSQETLFGESRLQPDSFFGVTGGQRVDTRDGASGVSSMSYSLSQLDAHGDVDPVAEADVYLAYGRDLQAEEILKEALRAQPERLAIRLKLLEVYAKRRDVRGFEQLATQLYAETKGTGEDWDKAQEMGRSIDPDNPLYQPGGAPRSMFDEDSPRPEPMNATTLPQAVPVSLMPAEPEERDEGPPSLIDLDLDLGSLPPSPPQAMSRTQAMPAMPPLDAQPSALDMDLDISEPMPLDGKKDNSLEFDLSDLGDLGGTTVSAQLGEESTASMGLSTQSPPDDESPVTKVGGDSLIDAMQDLGDDADPMMRQLELADEFRQIGDVEGARDVLQELLNQVGSGPLYEKAKAMLDELR